MSWEMFYLICFGLGWLSWHFIERPALTLKRRPTAPSFRSRRVVCASMGRGICMRAAWSRAGAHIGGDHHIPIELTAVRRHSRRITCAPDRPGGGAPSSRQSA